MDSTNGDKSLPVGDNVQVIAPGSLYAIQGDPSVYFTVFEDGSWMRKHISSQAFSYLGFGSQKITMVSAGEAPVQVSPVIYRSNLHPEGTLINLGQKVYLVKDGVLRYLKPSVFESNNYEWKSVLTATEEDSSLPIGQGMHYREGSLVGASGNIYIYSKYR